MAKKNILAEIEDIACSALCAGEHVSSIGVYLTALEDILAAVRFAERFPSLYEPFGEVNPNA